MLFPKKKNKYRNTAVTIGSLRFASRKESYFYIFLKARREAGEIKDFKCQYKILLIPDTDKFKAVYYIADYLVIHNDGSKEIYDVKSFITKKYPLNI